MFSKNCKIIFFYEKWFFYYVALHKLQIFLTAFVAYGKNRLKIYKIKKKYLFCCVTLI